MYVVDEMDKGVVVHDAQPVEEISMGLLKGVTVAPLRALRLEGGIVTIMANNGTWRYRLDPSDFRPDRRRMFLIERTGQLAPEVAG